ncbi:MAG: arylamine N-acetyltransferase [Opitutus sp.]|nr:arylamine N-acetyltransferase [Opitutus sp.]
MLSDADLDAYFARIGYEGPRVPTRPVLDGIAEAHARAIPFENIDVLLGRPIALDDASLVRKLVHARRGGYCFEQNGLFLSVLERLGFTVRPIGARVRWQKPADYTPPRTHLFLRVELDSDSWLVDVGIGGLSLTNAMPLAENAEHPTPRGPRRLTRDGTRWFHQAQVGGEWLDVCEFTLEDMPAIDREVGNWFTSTHPESHFRHRLIVTRATRDGNLTLQNRELTRRAQGREPEVRVLENHDELLRVLASDFGLEFPAATRIACSELVW